MKKPQGTKSQDAKDAFVINKDKSMSSADDHTPSRGGSVDWTGC